MPRAIKVETTAEQRSQLERMRDRDPKPYRRERASAILQLADGKSASEVAARGLLRPRYYETVIAWARAFQAEGLAGLTIRAGRGRKPAFSP